jgi:hypothetical protein
LTGSFLSAFFTKSSFEDLISGRDLKTS